MKNLKLFSTVAEYQAYSASTTDAHVAYISAIDKCVCNKITPLVPPQEPLLTVTFELEDEYCQIIIDKSKVTDIKYNGVSIYDEIGSDGYYTFPNGTLEAVIEYYGDAPTVWDYENSYPYDIVTYMGSGGYALSNMKRIELSSQIQNIPTWATYGVRESATFVLPKSLQYIASNAFNGFFGTIQYLGTKAEWDAILESDKFDEYSGRTLICTDYRSA